MVLLVDHYWDNKPEEEKRPLLVEKSNHRERERESNESKSESKSLPAGTKVMPPFPKEVHNIAPGSLILVRVLLQEIEKGRERMLSISS